MWTALALALAVQIAWHAGRAAGGLAEAGLPPAPSAAALRLASFGEPQAAARLAMLYVQSRAHRELDYARLVAWLDAVLDRASLRGLQGLSRASLPLPSPGVFYLWR